ncbi:uncharacterized protein At5g41620 isoform X2 [Cucumis sativus]|nr:uncharacterized protein At5g41620 isoform X2 [Cucumis sativus]XP_031743164.1 uncharacterized protein At5g41620 isoform X2 [Cucumis sativus]
MSTKSKSHSSKLSTTDDIVNRSPSCSVNKGKEEEEGGGGGGSVSRILKKNSEVVEDKSRELVSEISETNLSDPDRSVKNTKTTEKDEIGTMKRVHRRRRSAATEPCLRIGNGEMVGGSNFHGNDCLTMEIENGNVEKTTRRKTKTTVKTRLKEVSNCLTTSKELLRVLHHILLHEDHLPSSTSSLISALKSELDRAKTRVDHLIKDQTFNVDEIEVLKRRLAEEKAAWKYRERARFGSAISSMAEEMEIEKKLRRQAERLNKSIAKELAEAKVSVSKAMKEVEREKRAKEILEQICEELAKGIGEDRAEFEELKKESAKVREEVEKEREMLHLADVLREERVQMKLSEAKYQFEEKNAAVERLKHQLQGYFVIGNEEQNAGENREYSCNEFEKIKELEAYLKKINFGSCQDTEKMGKKEENGDCSDEEEEEEEEEEESDMHSIELNMDNNNKSYRWSFVEKADNNQIQINNGRKSVSEKIQWGSICLNTSNNNTHQQNSNSFDWDTFSELFTRKNLEELHDQLDDDDGGDNHQIKSVKCLRDILFPELEQNHNGVMKMDDEASSMVRKG